MTSIPVKLPWKILGEDVGVALQKLCHWDPGTLHGCQGPQGDPVQRYLLSLMIKLINSRCPGVYAGTWS